MRQIAKSELERILQQHKLRLESRGVKGAQANLQGTDLQEADLRGSDLRGAKLQAAHMLGADLQGADLRGAYLRGANLQGANLQGADLQGADLWGADLQGAQFDVNISHCWSFLSAKFTSDALPWLILHPRWAEMQKTVQINPV
jgi:uncharacterized protein YjbI with pentapeptide repeats